MALSRKRRKELNRLKNQAESVWEDQKEVLEHASKVMRDASRQAAYFAREDVPPRVKEAIEERVKPAIHSGVAGARNAVHATRERFVEDVLPAVSTALGTALAAVEVAKNKQVRDAIARVSKLGTEVGTKVGLVQPKPGPGRYILIGLGVVAAAAIAYAAWQTLRPDDDLWIDDEPEDIEAL